jgi:hypothetical protein
MAKGEYQRLTRARSRSAFGIVSTARSSLWLGKDHLLSIESTGYTENYKRLYFRDIQAITVRKTELGKIWSLVFAVLGGLLGLFAAVSGQAILAGVLGTLAGVFLLLLIVNLATGPTCLCQLHTAVQTEALTSLNRLRRARKVMNRLRPLITQAQGQLAPEEIPGRMRDLIGLSASANASPAGSPRYVTDDPNVPPRIIA